MSLAKIHILPKIMAAQYDGTNAADFTAYLVNIVLDSESGGVFEFHDLDPNYYTANAGDWITFTDQVGPSVKEVISDADFHTVYYTPVALADLIAVTGSAAPALIAAGMSAIPTVVANGNLTVDVTIEPELPDIDGAAFAHVVGGTLLGTLSVTDVEVLNTTTVRVSLHNTSLLLAVSGAHLLTTVSA